MLETRTSKSPKTATVWKSDNTITWRYRRLYRKPPPWWRAYWDRRFRRRSACTLVAKISVPRRFCFSCICEWWPCPSSGVRLNSTKTKKLLQYFAVSFGQREGKKNRAGLISLQGRKHVTSPWNILGVTHLCLWRSTRIHSTRYYCRRPIVYCCSRFPKRPPRNDRRSRGTRFRRSPPNRRP